MNQVTAPTHQLVIIDSRVNDWQRLASSVAIGTDLLILDSSSDGLAQISDYLTALPGQQFQSIQIISHGGVGSLLLGSSTVTGSNLGSYSKQLATMGNALTDTGDILLYGCNVAAGDLGRRFIEDLAGFTGADVAASDDLTGAAGLGGDWVLEAQTGAIESRVLNSTDYQYVLPVTSTPNIATYPGKTVGEFGNDYAFAVIKTDGSVVTWGYARYGGDSSTVAAALNGTTDVTQIYSTEGAFAALRTDGSVVTWGDASYAGDSNTVATALNGTTDVTQIYSTSHAFAALRTDGSVVTWGDASYGGDSSTVATALNGTTDVTQIYSTQNAFAALRTDGSVVTWGHANWGGNSNTVAAALNGTTDVTQIYSSRGAFAALRTDGSVVTWGEANYGSNSRTVAAALNGTTDVTQIYFTDYAFAALRTDGSVVTWGESNGGDSSAVASQLTSDVVSVANIYTDDFYTAANTTPVSSVNTGLTVLEDAAITTITSAMLNVTDAEQATSALTYTVTTASTKGTLSKSGAVLALNGSFTQADINNGLVKYTPTLNANGSDSVGFSVSDGAGGTLSGQTFAIGITAMNDAPILTSFTSTVATDNEDSQIVVTFADLQIQGNEADSDGTVTAFVVKAVSSGTLKIGLSASTATAWNALSNNTIDATHQAYWTPSANANGTVNAFTAVAKDNGGLESVTPVQATVSLAAVPDVNVAAGVTPVEGGTAGTFTVTLDSAAPVGGLTVNYTLAGTATLSTDYTVTAGSSFTIAAGQTSATLAVNAVEDAVSDPNETVDLTLATGADYQLGATNPTVTLTITDTTNTPPTAANKTIIFNEDNSYAFASTDFGYADTENNAMASVKITNLPTVGSLKLSGNAVTLNQEIPTTSLANLTFTPAANINGSAYANFNFTVNDGNLSSVSANTITFNVTAVNDLPIGTVAITGIPTQGQTLTAGNNLTDVDGLGLMSYTWKTDTAVLGVGNTYALAATDVGKTITVTASYTDLQGTVESKSSVATPPVSPPSIPAFIITKNDLLTGEDGDTAIISVALATAPTRDVSVTFSSSDTSEGIITGNSTLTFNSNNWNNSQNFSVRGVNDFLDPKSDTGFYSVTGIVTTDDVNYVRVAILPIDLSNLGDKNDAGFDRDIPLQDYKSLGYDTTGYLK